MLSPTQTPEVGPPKKSWSSRPERSTPLTPATGIAPSTLVHGMALTWHGPHTFSHTHRHKMGGKCLCSALMRGTQVNEGGARSSSTRPPWATRPRPASLRLLTSGLRGWALWLGSVAGSWAAPTPICSSALRGVGMALVPGLHIWILSWSPGWLKLGVLQCGACSGGRCRHLVPHIRAPNSAAPDTLPGPILPRLTAPGSVAGASVALPSLASVSAHGQ